MTADYTNLIQIPGIRARVVVDADYNWNELGQLLAEGYDHEQGDLIEALARGLHAMPSDGLVQLQYLADWLKTPGDEDYTYDLDAVRWFLRELLIRLEEDA